MDEVVGKSKTGRRLARNLVAGLCGFAVSFALLLAALRVQDFLPAWYVKLLMFAIPLPVACGLAVGFVSPRKAIAWAPLWSGTCALLLVGVLSGLVRDMEVALSPARIAGIFGAAILSAAAGLLGQWAASRDRVTMTSLGLVLLCCLMGGIGHGLFTGELRGVEREVVPQVLLEADRDYLALPRSMQWTCRRQLPTGCYVLSSMLNGRPIRICISARARSLSYVEHSTGTRETLRTVSDVREYLKRYGVRDALLSGLTEDKESGIWQAVYRGTRLTVWNDGLVRIGGIPAATAAESREARK